MNLDFLDVLSQPTQETVGTARTVRTDSIHATLPVPNAVLAVENHENQMPRSPVGAGDGAQWFPSGSQTLGTETPNLLADVPEVPKVPNEGEQLCTERARVQVSRWMAARCMQSRRVWAAEKFLYRDYTAWCQQYHQSPFPRELFCAMLNKLFQREENGWQGVCLATDVATVGYIM